MNVNRAFLVFALVTALTLISDRILFVIFPNYLLYKKFTATQIGLIFSIASLILLISRAFIGKASDKFGRKRIMSLGLFTESVSMLFFPIVNRLYEFSIVKGLREMSDTLTTSVKDAIIGDLFEKRIREKIIRKLGNVFVFSRALAVAIGFIVVTYFSLIAGFYAASASLFIAFIVFTIFIKEEKPKREIKTKLKISIKKYSLGFKLIVLVGFLQSIVFGASYYPGFFILAKNLGITENMLFLTLFAVYVSGGLIIWLTNKKIDKFNKAKLVLVSQFLFSALIIAYPFSTSILQFVMILFGVHLFFIYYWIGFKVVLLDNTIKRFRGEQVGFEKTIEGIGDTIGPVIGGFLIDAVSLSSAFFLAGFVGMISTLVAYYLTKI